MSRTFNNNSRQKFTITKNQQPRGQTSYFKPENSTIRIWIGRICNQAQHVLAPHQKLFFLTQFNKSYSSWWKPQLNGKEKICYRTQQIIREKGACQCYSYCGLWYVRSFSTFLRQRVIDADKPNTRFRTCLMTSIKNLLLSSYKDSLFSFLIGHFLFQKCSLFINFLMYPCLTSIEKVKFIGSKNNLVMVQYKRRA